MSTTYHVPGEDRNDDFWYNFGYDGLQLEIDSYALDDHDSGSHGLKDSRLVVDDVEWETLTLSGSVSVVDGLPGYVFEDGTEPSTAGRLFVRADCKATHERFVADEILDFDGAGHFGFEAELEREAIADSVELEPVLVRDSSPTTENRVYGQTPGLKLADGPSFEIQPEGDEDADASFLAIETKSFEEEGRDGQLFYVDHSVASEPTLYINSDVDLLVPTLQSKAPYGPKRWTKESVERLIGQPAWVELVLWTASDITDGECAYEWQEDVIAKLAEVRGESTKAVSSRLEAQIRDGDRVDTLVEEANESVQMMLEIDDPLENLFEEVL